MHGYKFVKFLFENYKLIILTIADDSSCCCCIGCLQLSVETGLISLTITTD